MMHLNDGSFFKKMYRSMKCEHLIQEESDLSFENIV